MVETNQKQRQYIPQMPEVVKKNIKLIECCMVVMGCFITVATLLLADNIAQKNGVSSDMAKSIGVALGVLEIFLGLVFRKFGYWPEFTEYETVMSNCKRLVFSGVAGITAVAAAYFGIAESPFLAGAGLFFAGLSVIGLHFYYVNNERQKAFQRYLAAQAQKRE